MSTDESDEERRGNARAAYLAMEDGAVAAKSLERLRQLNGEELAELSKQGDELREKMLCDSAVVWVRQK
jgi:hypothetical protein